MAGVNVMVVRSGRLARLPVSGLLRWRCRAFIAAALIPLAAVLIPAAATAAAGLTELEQSWIDAGQPVLRYARQVGLPVDIIVQPTVRLDVFPLSMAFIDGRCKLVLTMRGNPIVERQLRDAPDGLRTILIETMVAHELGHCWRHTQGAWRALPSGFAAPSALNGLQGRNLSRNQADSQRREEGFADLVGLAWVRNRHPAAYAQVHTWLVGQRDEPAAPGAAHDTLMWVELARDPAVLGRGERGVFEQALGLWEAGLRGAE